MRIKNLLLDNFRNHTNLAISETSKFNFIIGENGIGKTNIVEALSMFSPGKGLRSAALDEMINHRSTKWTVFATLMDADNVLNIGSEYTKSIRRRSIVIDGKAISNSEKLLEHIRVMWLLPQMDYMLSESKVLRRKFFDRIAYNFFPEHALLIKKYEHILKSRLKLLKNNITDEILLSQYENMLASFSIDIIKNRQAALNYLNAASKDFSSNFLKPEVIKRCLCAENPNATFIAEGFKSSRSLDAKLGRSMFGVHRADYTISNTEKNITVNFCSTGEQKAMLIALVIAQIKILNKEFNLSPILILDDIFSHLDANRSAALLKELSCLDAQIWITTTFIDIKTIESECNEYIKIMI